MKKVLFILALTLSFAVTSSLSNDIDIGKDNPIENVVNVDMTQYLADVTVNQADYATIKTVAIQSPEILFATITDEICISELSQLGYPHGDGLPKIKPHLYKGGHFKVSNGSSGGLPFSC